MLLPILFAFVSTISGVMAQQAAVRCSIPTKKSCPELQNAECSMQLVDYEVDYEPVYDENNLLIGYDPVVTYPSCENNKEDRARNMADVDDCTDSASTKDEANSLPGDARSKVCFITRTCKPEAMKAKFKEWVYPRDSQGNVDYSKPQFAKRAYWAICESLTESTDSTPFDIPVEMSWTTCTPHDNCQRAGGGGGGPQIDPLDEAN